MRETLWPFKLLLLAAYVAWYLLLGALVWLTAISPLPEWLKHLCLALLGSAGWFGAVHARRRYRADKNPWSLDKPERG